MAKPQPDSRRPFTPLHFDRSIVRRLAAFHPKMSRVPTEIDGTGSTARITSRADAPRSCHFYRQA
jgi:hypothetical protein